MSNFMNICPVGAELLYVERGTGRRTHLTKPLVAFRNFVIVLK